jgi:WhiB family redox-sensing transcriptional regulator
MPAPGGGWRESALCAQADPEAFFPEKGGSVKAAKRICARCPVRRECLEEALARRERFGIRGGLTARERRPLVRNQAGPGDAGEEIAEAA